MPRLQILQHKSYHPYLEKNKQRVREDEAKARAEEEEKEQRRVEAESSARLDQLRRRAGSPSVQAQEEDDNLPSTSTSAQQPFDNLMEKHRKAKARAEKDEKRRKDRLDFDFPSDSARKAKKAEVVVDTYDVDENGREAVWETNGHINLFADLERNDKGTLDNIAKAKAPVAAKVDPFTMYLSRPDRETKPWYTDREMKRAEEKEISDEAEIRRARDARKDKRSKERHDPLTSITARLAKDKSHTSSRLDHRSMPKPSGDLREARLARESSERERALAMIAKAKAATPSPWEATPSSVGGTWTDSFEREKDRAGRRFFGDTPDSRGERRW